MGEKKEGTAPFLGATLDSRLVKPGMVFVALKGGRTDGRNFIPQALAAGASRIIEGQEELERAACDYRRGLRAKVVGVTGSAGKTTTKEFLRTFLSCAGKAHATEGNFNNHIGLPLTILNCPPDADFLVVEMGTNHPGEIARLCDIADPDVGVLTNVGTAHLEFFGTRDGIAAEKGTLLARARDFSAALADNARLDALKAVRSDLAVVDPRPAWLAEALVEVLPGDHNVANAALAFAVAERYGVTRGAAERSLGGFKLPGARWRRSEMDGVRFIDDTYNASPGSMVAALDAFAKVRASGRRIAVLGDMFELGDAADALHAEVFDHAAGLGLDAVVAVGERSSRCRAARAYGSVDALAAEFRSLLRPGDVVLLKASHGMNLGKLLA